MSNLNHKTSILQSCFGNGDCKVVECFSLYIYSSNISYVVDDIERNQIFLCYESDNSFNINQCPYIYFGGSQMMYYIIKLEGNFYINSDYLICLSGIYYLYTTTNNNVPMDDYIWIIRESDAFVGKSICTRKDTVRYLFFYSQHDTFIDCPSWTINNETNMNVNILFNYPDCYYNSSIYDLILLSLNGTFTFSNEILSWSTIMFTSINQPIEINNDKTLVIDKLDLNQKNIFINEHVYIKNLIVTSTGAIFDVIDFDSIDYDVVNDDEIVLVLRSTQTNLTDFGLKQCDNRLATQATNCSLLPTVIVDYFDDSSYSPMSHMKITVLCVIFILIFI